MMHIVNLSKSDATTFTASEKKDEIFLGPIFNGTFYKQQVES